MGQKPDALGVREHGRGGAGGPEAANVSGGASGVHAGEVPMGLHATRHPIILANNNLFSHMLCYTGHHLWTNTQRATCCLPTRQPTELEGRRQGGGRTLSLAGWGEEGILRVPIHNVTLTRDVAYAQGRWALKHACHTSCTGGGNRGG